jgi:hypothetical protein
MPAANAGSRSGGGNWSRGTNARGYAIKNARFIPKRMTRSEPASVVFPAFVDCCARRTIPNSGAYPQRTIPQ